MVGLSIDRGIQRVNLADRCRGGEEAWDEQATGEGIRRAFKQLAARVAATPPERQPVRVLFHFSGHGSQVPDQASGPDRDEDDGFDETLVPFDALEQGGEQDIRDDEINAFVQDVSQDGRAKMLLVLDCCHSGTGARGATRTRQLDRSAQQPTVSNVPLNRKKFPPNVVFLSACRAREVEPEFQDGDITYGLLTRFLVEVLSDELKVSQLSYDLLQRSIVSRYLSDRRVLQAPTPQIEADPDALRATVLGAGSDVDRPPYHEAVRESATTVRLKAGSFQNVTVGSVYELYDSPEKIASTDATSAAWLRITDVKATTSEGQTGRWDDEQSQFSKAELPAGFMQGYAVQRVHEPGDTTLKVKVVSADGGEALSADSVPPAITKSLSGDEKTSWLKWVSDDVTACDVVLRMDGDKGALFPGTGIGEVFQTNDHLPTSLRGGWGPIDLNTGQDLSPEPRSLVDLMRQIARARNLVSLAGSEAIREAPGYNVKLELLKVDYDFDNDQVKSATAWPPDSEDLPKVPNESVYAFRVRNDDPEGKPIYVSVLSISPSMGIEVVMPYLEEHVKLEAGESRDSDPYLCEAPFGEGQIIVLATREPTDFSFVAQADLPTGGAADLTDRILEEAYFQKSATRGRRLRRKSTDEATWRAEVLRLRFVP